MTLKLRGFLSLPVYLTEKKKRNIHLDFRNSLLKYARNKRRHKFGITRITVDYSVK